MENRARAINLSKYILDLCYTLQSIHDQIYLQVSILECKSSYPNKENWRELRRLAPHFKDKA